MNDHRSINQADTQQNGSPPMRFTTAIIATISVLILAPSTANAYTADEWTVVNDLYQKITTLEDANETLSRENTKIRGALRSTRELAFSLRTKLRASVYVKTRSLTNPELWTLLGAIHGNMEDACINYDDYDTSTSSSGGSQSYSFYRYTDYSYCE